MWAKCAMYTWTVSHRDRWLGENRQTSLSLVKAQPVVPGRLGDTT